MSRLLLTSLGFGLFLSACNADADATAGTTPPAKSAAAGPPPDAPGAGAATGAPVEAGPVAAVGQAAPDFTLTDTQGNTVKLSDYAGKTVVLEWFNPGCPFVKYAYEEGVLPNLASEWTSREVIWLAINSGAPGKQGHGVETNEKARGDWNINTPVLIDESGAVGQRYGAKTTPHMYVVDSAGVLRYAGGLDNAPLGRVEGDARVDYVDQALQQLDAGQDVAVTTAKPYGCSVKYGS